MTDIDTRALLAWCAGLFDGVGMVVVTPEKGPTEKEYHAITIELVGLNPDQGERLVRAAGNGEYSDSLGVYSLSGFAAVRGLLAALWPYLTAHSRARANESIRRYKYYRGVDKASRGR